ncbi:nucleoside-diphosphate kinase [bacterium]|nr:nucleoside-diphosphate kinase [bacterium]
MQRTLTIIKPDAVGKNLAGGVLDCFERAGLRIVAAKMLWLQREQAEAFYYVHKEREFFGSLCEFMSSGPCIVAVLEGEDAIKKARAIMGATDPKNAEEGTIRKQFASSVQENAVHGSDAPATAEFEIGFFFSKFEIMQTKRKN